MNFSKNLPEPSGLYAPPGLTFSNSTFCPHSVFMCFLLISEQTVIISLYNINWLIFITEMECVYCAVRTGSLNYLFICLSDGYVDSVVQLPDLLFPIIFGSHTLKIKPCVSTNGAGPSLLFDQCVCRNDREIILCDMNVSQGNHIQKVDESFQRPHCLVIQACLQLNISKVSAMFLLSVCGRSFS